VLLWTFAGAALLCGLAALGLTRRLSRKMDALNQAYWELRYDYTRLRSQVARLDPETSASTADPPAPSSSPPATVSFVPLASIRKKDQ
jgi:hypothetical protein